MGLITFPERVGLVRRIVVGALAILFVQSLIATMPLLLVDHWMFVSRSGCVVIRYRDAGNDIYEPRAWIPYPLLIAITLLPPLVGWLLARRRPHV